MKFSINSVQENKKYDVIVIGAGHAGCEAALASARLGCTTAILTIDRSSVAMMPCNPNIGGTSKGHLVKELDALGGEMGKVIDQTFIQSKMLNQSKGPAVHSLRAQADKDAYHDKMLSVIEQQEYLDLIEAEVQDLIFDKTQKKILGVKLVDNRELVSGHVILCTGTYLKARCIKGEESENTGPNHLKASYCLSGSLESLDIKLQRYKTGTPARIARSSVHFEKMEEQFGDERIIPFSFTTEMEALKDKHQISCWLTYTNEETHNIIRRNLDRSPLYSGMIEGTGPRYCPSIEDKIVRFPDKNRHQVFLEPEGLDTEEMYVGGMSSSLPVDVQKDMYRSVRGLEDAVILKPAYAIEYDCIDARQLKSSLEFKEIRGLYSAGQFNGSSGYEEAAVQGLMAGINAARSVKGEQPVIIDRSDGYIGVLIDDLVTKESHEPYRMMTSRAEYRLLLRQDNADQRLTPIGYRIGLINEDRYQKLLLKEKQIEEEILRLEKTTIGNNDIVQNVLLAHNSTPLRSGSTLAELLRRPEISYEDLETIDPHRPGYPYDVTFEVEVQLKYEGYIRRQQKQVSEFKKMEGKKIPVEIDYSAIHNLRTEAKQKLTFLKPENIGQASRISGVSPSDISVLLIFLEQYNRRRANES